jgi:hypothetical protein
MPPIWIPNINYCAGAVSTCELVVDDGVQRVDYCFAKSSGAGSHNIPNWHFYDFGSPLRCTMLGGFLGQSR